MKHTLARRTLLKLGGGILAAAPFIRLPQRAYADAEAPVITPARRPFGRALQANAIVRELPVTTAAKVRSLKFNEVIPITGQTESDDSPSRHNKTWYQTSDGYVHSSLIQPSENVLNQPVDAIADTLWGEVTVPVVNVHVAADPDARRMYSTYFGCTYKVLDVVEGADKAAWYRISDGILDRLFVLAAAIRPIAPDEFSPISPGVPLDQKRIEVDLKQQIATAYEGDKPVFSARVATGTSFRLDDGTVQSFITTPGAHHIFEKRPSHRMIGGRAGDSDHYDLPGVPWVSYFTRSRIAFHGTYWHNDYGRPRSHGCVNMLPEDAHWVYRWTTPSAADRALTLVKDRGEGSLVKVF